MFIWLFCGCFWVFTRILVWGEPWKIRSERCQASASSFSAPPLLDSAAASRRHPFSAAGNRQTPHTWAASSWSKRCFRECMFSQNIAHAKCQKKTKAKTCIEQQRKVVFLVKRKKKLKKSALTSYINSALTSYINIKRYIILDVDLMVAGVN